MYTYRVQGTLIAPGPHIGESRLWINREIGPVWTRQQALETAIEIVCREEDLSIYDVQWAPDLRVFELGVSKNIQRLQPIPPPPPRPARPPRGDVSVVMDYLSDLEQHVDLLERVIEAIRSEADKTLPQPAPADHVRAFMVALLHLMRTVDKQEAAR